jgi:hypothetical protein
MPVTLTNHIHASRWKKKKKEKRKKTIDVYG